MTKLTFAFLLDLNKDFLRVSLEVCIGIVNSVLMLIIELGQLRELKVLGEGPVELLDWELVHAGVDVANGDVVIGVDTCKQLLSSLLCYL